ncbi:tripartite motif containing 105 [Chanos chanos]|uniref:Tripartite motif containing 105 n=1 Tax=Chanos chanos TaxID=29144 RepID=A0A6J2UQG6_CHACN|nr:zinc-binding protein A33-like [Chanos chanos]
MASNKNKMSLRDDLTCAICYDLFKEPVMLGCMHHFCKRCITTYWRSIRGPVSCPQCRQEFPSKQFQTNYLVAGLVEKVRATSSDRYVKNLEKQIKDTLKLQRSQRDEFIGMIRKDNEQLDLIRQCVAELQERVHGDFQALHHFLEVEEAAVLEELNREQEAMVEEMGRHLEGLQEAVREAEQNLQALQQAIGSTDHNVLVELPELNSRASLQAIKGPDIDVSAFRSKYMAPLQYTMWRKMFKFLRPGPAPLTFDDDTAHPSLLLSQDKTQVVEYEGILPYKLNPKRFIQCINVLAAQGFQSGRHYWEVAVGNKPKWDLGVALEAVDRQVRVKLCPENGYWTLRLRNGNEYSAGTQPWTPLRIGSSPQRIGIFLDCEERQVSFYNADSMTLLYSFSSGPRGKAFPFFSTCLSDRGQKPLPIRILHSPTVAL